MDRNNRMSGVLSDHPARVSALGIIPLVAASSTLASSVLTACAFLIVLLVSSVTLSLPRNLIPHPVRLVYILLVTATWVTVLDWLLQVYLYELRMQLDIYLPLMALNSLLLMVMEKDALTMTIRPLAGKIMKLAALPVGTCVANGLIREWLVSGHLAINLQAGITHHSIYPVSLPLFATATGAFLVTGCVLALANLVTARTESTRAGSSK